MTTFTETNSVAFRKVTNHISTKIISSAAKSRIQKIMSYAALKESNNQPVRIADRAMTAQAELRAKYYQLLLTQQQSQPVRL